MGSTTTPLPPVSLALTLICPLIISPSGIRMGGGRSGTPDIYIYICAQMSMEAFHLEKLPSETGLRSNTLPSQRESASSLTA